LPGFRQIDIRDLTQQYVVIRQHSVALNFALWMCNWYV